MGWRFLKIEATRAGQRPKEPRGLAAEGSEGILIKTTVAAFADFCFLDLCADLSRELDT